MSGDGHCHHASFLTWHGQSGSLRLGTCDNQLIGLVAESFQSDAGCLAAGRHKMPFVIRLFCLVMLGENLAVCVSFVSQRTRRRGRDGLMNLTAELHEDVNGVSRRSHFLLAVSISRDSHSCEQQGNGSKFAQLRLFRTKCLYTTVTVDLFSRRCTP